ncbi:DNA ligase [Herbaspirillum robiniae]|uniref:DNA ligase n=1 Tax=Herbaspirillum robiniae TaxID=2014887 RepID=A0ABX2M432_9BURK|nr:DNA ligase [Herbaspirillum robiniae]NUU02486.1 DNA ligase [Herbaspirillum robiniae]
MDISRNFPFFDFPSRHRGHDAGRRAWLRLLPVAALFPGALAAAGKPPLMLANSYREGVLLQDYWVSEKYDGIRAFWDGARLLTRGGEVIQAPSWFVRGWPAQAMDGELWGGRGRFEETVSTVRQQTPNEAAWRAISFMVFDLPREPGSFDRRLAALGPLVASLRQPWVEAVRQRKVASHQALQQLLEDVEHQGGEGLVLHRGASLYKPERNDDLLKFKSMEDAEARVVDYLAGKGKYQGMVGALVVETPQGLRFSIGSGLSDAQRRDPPPVGSIVTYRYRGLHGSGKPRFAALLRQRNE